MIMKLPYKFVTLLVFSLNIPVASGQDVIETTKPDFSNQLDISLKFIYNR
jgi:hypothetical protein